MAAKFLAVALLVTSAQGSTISGHAAPHISFVFGVPYPHTPDVKNQHESSIEVGQYSPYDSDASKPTIDAHNEFNAIVSKDQVYAHDAPIIGNIAPVVGNTYSGRICDGGYAGSIAYGYSNGHAAPFVADCAPILFGYMNHIGTGHVSGFTGYGAVTGTYLNDDYLS